MNAANTPDSLARDAARSTMWSLIHGEEWGQLRRAIFSDEVMASVVTAQLTYGDHDDFSDFSSDVWRWVREANHAAA